MVKAVTLYVYDTKELRIAKNFIILSFLFGIVGAILSYSFPGVIAHIVIPLISLAIGITGFYKISKLARSVSLFKNFSFSVLINLVAGVILIFDIQRELAIVLYFVLIILNFYWAYKFFAELSVLSNDNFFINGFRTICCSLILCLLVASFPNLIQLALFIFSLGILIGGGCIFFGFFRLKQITYFVFSEDT